MTTLDPLTPNTDSRLYKVRLTPDFTCNGIIAPNAPAAIDEALKGFKDRAAELRQNIVEVTCENIYEASIGLDCAGRDDAPDDLDTKNAIFDITIRGTDPKRVNELKLALMHLIGFPFNDKDDEPLCGSTEPLERALEDVMVSSY